MKLVLPGQKILTRARHPRSELLPIKSGWGAVPEARKRFGVTRDVHVVSSITIRLHERHWRSLKSLKTAQQPPSLVSTRSLTHSHPSTPST